MVVADCGTSEAARIVEDLSKKLAVASYAIVKNLSLEEDIRVRQASETLDLAKRLKKAEEEVRSLGGGIGTLLEEENALLKERYQKMELAVTDNEKVLENLHNTIKNDAILIAELKGKVKSLEV